MIERRTPNTAELTIDDAERALRHGVILRKLSSWPRTPVGSRPLAPLPQPEE